MRHLALSLLLCAGACSSLSSEQHDQLVSHQQNAKYYLEGGQLDRSMDQIQRGLELDPDDYVLNSMLGALLLQRSGDASGSDHRELDKATAVLERIYETRSPNRHEPHLLFNYGLVQEKQGRRHLASALRLERQQVRGDSGGEDIAREHELAKSLLTEARTLFGVLVDRGEQLRLAHYHLLLIAKTLGDDTAFDLESTEYFAAADKHQANVRKEIETTTTANWEADRLTLLRSLQAEELEVRSLVAEQEFGHKNYEKALGHLNRILDLEPQRSADYYNRGRVLLILGRSVEAKDDFRKFLATTTLPPGNEKKAFAQEALTR